MASMAGTLGRARTPRTHKPRHRNLRFEPLESRQVLSALGLVAGNQSDSVALFDGETDTILGTVDIPRGIRNQIGDVAITRDGRLGFVTDFDYRVRVLDLSGGVPTLAVGNNLIKIANAGEDLALTADERYLIVTDGSNPEPVSVIDVASRQQISYLQVGRFSNSVAVTRDNTVLVTSDNGFLRKLAIAPDGQLIDTGESLKVTERDIEGDPDVELNNVYVAPGGWTGIAVARDDGRAISFSISEMTKLDESGVSGSYGLSAEFSRDGSILYVRSKKSVDAFLYDPFSGAIGEKLFSSSITETNGFYGMDQMVLSPDGEKLYVTQIDGVLVFDARTGEQQGWFADEDLRGATGIAFAADWNSVPKAQDDFYQTDEDTALVIAAPGVLANDFGADRTPLTAFIESAPANGSVQLASDGSFTYLPAPDFHGIDTFSYVASGGDSGRSVATITVTVRPILDAAIATGPGGGQAPLNLNSNGMLPVVFYSGGVDQFDARTIDFDSVRLNGKQVELHKAIFDDIDGDGLVDLMLKYDIESVRVQGVFDRSSTAAQLLEISARTFARDGAFAEVVAESWIELLPERNSGRKRK